MLKAGPSLDRESCLDLRRRLIFECHKWDPQAGDVEVLARYPLILEAEAWNRLAGWSEQLAREMLAAEAELANRPDLHRRLGLPRQVRRLLRWATRNGPAVSGPRCTRFDWHLTTEGWRISEANTDVPGGFIEAGGLCSLMSEQVGGLGIAGDPGETLADALHSRCGSGANVALVHATAYTDDRQVMVYLARKLRERGMQPHLLGPQQVSWSDGQAFATTDWWSGPLNAVFRFFPGEWLANLPRRSGREGFFSGTCTPQTNPGTALLVQSKRWPLVWDLLRTPLEAWRTFLPATCDPRRVSRRDARDWVVKPAMGRVGDGVGILGVSAEKEFSRIQRFARWLPGRWAAQRRFEAVAVHTPDGERYPCIGVFVIDGRTAGIYGRIAPRPLIDARAQDVAVLVSASASVLATEERQQVASSL